MFDINKKIQDYRVISVKLDTAFHEGARIPLYSEYEKTKQEIISEFERLTSVDREIKEAIITIELLNSNISLLKAENERLKGEVKELEVLIMGFPSQ